MWSDKDNAKAQKAIDEFTHIQLKLIMAEKNKTLINGTIQFIS